LIVDNVVYYKHMEDISIKLILAVALLLVFFAYWIFNFIIIYHLNRFGIGTQPKRFAVVFLLGSIALFFVCILIFANVDTTNLLNLISK